MPVYVLGMMARMAVRQPRKLQSLQPGDGCELTLRIRIGDVIFGETAISREEGKWETTSSGESVFKPDYQVITKNCADLQGFSHNRGGIRYGSYITVSSVRENAKQDFKEIRDHVRVIK